MWNLHCILVALAAMLIVATAESSFTKRTYGVEDFKGHVSAFGDFNSDKHADMFVVQQNTDTKKFHVYVYLWETRKNKYVKLDTKHTITEDKPITSIIPGDFNYDGRLDIMVLGTSSDKMELSESYAHIYLGFLDDFSVTYKALTPAPVGEPVPIDSNNDMKMEWYGLSYPTSSDPTAHTAHADTTATSISPRTATPSSPPHPSSTQPVRTLWLYAGNDGSDFPVYTASQHVLPSHHAFTSLCMGAVPVSVDLNGDCLADLLIPACKPGTEMSNLARSGDIGNLTVGKNGIPKTVVGNPKTAAALTPSEEMVWEIWINDPQETGKNPSEKWHYRLHDVNPAYIGMQQPTFYDVNADGNIDVIIPVCYPLNSCAEASQVHVWFNEQMPMCSRMSESGCRAQQDLCVPDDKFDIGGLRIGDANHVVVNTNAPFSLPTSQRPLSLSNAPISLRLGDATLSGHPDLLLTLTDAANNVATPARVANQGLVDVKASAVKTQVVVYTATLCTAALCSQAATDRGLFTFIPSTHVSTTIFSKDVSSNEGLTTFKNAYAAAFIDVGNTGNLDLLVLYSDATATPAIYAQVHENVLTEDAYFLTTLGSNGVCDAWCSGKMGEFPNPKPYGVSQVGTTFKFTVTSLSGHKTPRQTVQQPQQSYLALSTAYTVSGLGRTSNYIEELFAGFTIASKHYNLWIAMIPNSQIVVFPYPINNPTSWTLEQFIFPTDRLVSVIIALVVTLAVNGIVILVLRSRERAEEKKEKQRQRHLFAF